MNVRANIRTGFTTKQVLFAFPVQERDDFSIVGTTNKELFKYSNLCPDYYRTPNTKDFYLKIGNVVCIEIPPSEVADIAFIQYTILGRLKTTDIPCGSYLITVSVYEDYATIAFCSVYPHRLYNNQRYCPNPGPIVNVYPRYHWEGVHVLNCVKIYLSPDDRDLGNYTNRDLRRGKDNKTGYQLGIKQYLYFKQLSVDRCIQELNQINVNQQGVNDSYVGIYVPKNTSLIMIDLAQLLLEEESPHERTLFQEGAVIILENIELRLKRAKSDLEERGFRKDECGITAKNPFYVLRPLTRVCNETYETGESTEQAFLTAWLLQITGIVEGNKSIACLVVPEGGRFTQTYDWPQGYAEVINKIGQNIQPKPWDKYLFKPNPPGGPGGPGGPDELGDQPYPDYDPNNITEEDWAPSNMNFSFPNQVSGSDSNDWRRSQSSSQQTQMGQSPGSGTNVAGQSYLGPNYNRRARSLGASQRSQSVQSPPGRTNVPDPARLRRSEFDTDWRGSSQSGPQPPQGRGGPRSGFKRTLRPHNQPQLPSDYVTVMRGGPPERFYYSVSTHSSYPKYNQS